jgi:hypothetical protein
VADAIAQLNRMIERLRSLGDVEQFAPDVAKELRSQILKGAENEQGPDGSAWPATADGHQPLQNAAQHLRVTAVGSRIVARLSGHYVNQSIGWTRGGKARPIMPTRRLSQPMSEAIKAVIRKRFGEAMAGD